MGAEPLPSEAIVTHARVDEWVGEGQDKWLLAARIGVIGKESLRPLSSKHPETSGELQQVSVGQFISSGFTVPTSKASPYPLITITLHFLWQELTDCPRLLERIDFRRVGFQTSLGFFSRAKPV